MRVCILGLHSPIGRHMAAALAARNHQVIGTSRASRPREDLASLVENYHSLHLGEAADPNWFSNVDAVVYLAHDHSRGATRRNVQGIQDWFHTASTAGANRHLFFTSYSSKAESRTDYGSIKFELESFFISRQQWIVRPGLVTSAEGLFGRMLRMVQKLPMLPLLDGGRDPVPLVALESVSTAVITILEKSMAPGSWNLHHPPPLSMKELLVCMRRLTKSHCRFIPIPAALPFALLRFTELLGLRLPLSADSIAAMKENRGIMRPSNLADLGIQDPPLKEQVTRLIRKTSGEAAQ